MWPCCSPRSTIQSASTPPPSPPMAMIAILMGEVDIGSGLRGAASGSEGVALAPARVGTLPPTDERNAQALTRAFPAPGMADEPGPVERRAQDRGLRHVAAVAATHAAVQHGGHRIGAQRVRVGLDRQRRATRQPD